jgi:hypothetical protein
MNKMTCDNQAATVIVGRRQPCRSCQASVRVCYLIARDTYWVIEDPQDPASGRLIGHDCGSIGRGVAA